MGDLVTCNRQVPGRLQYSLIRFECLGDLVACNRQVPGRLQYNYIKVSGRLLYNLTALVGKRLVACYITIRSLAIAIYWLFAGLIFLKPIVPIV